MPRQEHAKEPRLLFQRYFTTSKNTRQFRHRTAAFDKAQQLFDIFIAPGCTNGKFCWHAYVIAAEPPVSLSGTARKFWDRGLALFQRLAGAHFGNALLDGLW